MASQTSHHNAKRGPKKRHWCFTSYLAVLPTTFDKAVVRYCIYQREICPETKREHFQGYIELFCDYRRGQVITLLGACHLEPRYASRTSAREYCRKKYGAIANTQVEFGKWRDQIAHKRKLSDMLGTDMTLADLIKESPVDYVRYHRGLEKLFARRQAASAKVFRRVEVLVYIGVTGCGKTGRALETPDHYKLPISDRLWFDGYQGEKCLVIDDFYGNIKYGFFLQILDGHELQLPVKGGFIWAMWNKVIITSNKDPKDWYNKGYLAGVIPPALNRRITKVIHFK